jgi:hypothetical protein
MLAEMKANQEMMARMDAKIWSMQAELKSATKDSKFNREETKACQGNMEARLQGEPASVDTTPEVAQEQEFPREDAVEMPVGESRERRRDGRNLAAVRRQKKKDRNLDARRRRKENKRAQSKDACRRNLVAARRRTTRRAAVARRRRILVT